MITFRNRLKETDFEDILKIDCPNLAHDTFIDNYIAASDIAERIFIWKYVKRESWFTSGLLTSFINKSMLLSLKLHKPTSENILYYKIIQYVVK